MSRATDWFHDDWLDTPTVHQIYELIGTQRTDLMLKVREVAWLEAEGAFGSRSPVVAHLMTAVVSLEAAMEEIEGYQAKEADGGGEGAGGPAVRPLPSPPAIVA